MNSPRTLPATQIRPARQPGGCDLFRSAKVRLGKPDLLPGTCYLAFVTLGKPLVHWITSGSAARRRCRGIHHRRDFPWAWLR